MNVVRTITISIVVAAFSLCFQSYSFGQESEDVKSEIKELKQMMEKMQQRITDLEEKNKALEEQVKEEQPKENVVVKEETEPIPAATETPPQQEGFLSKVAQTLNPEISVVGLFAAAWYSLNDPVVFAEVDPQNTGVNIQEIVLGCQSVVDP
ncbi:MAG: hypothetical protein ACREOP_07160 [Thermodesulfobacteriota bacterium]